MSPGEMMQMGALENDTGCCGHSVRWTLGFCSKEVLDHLARYSLTLSPFYRARSMAMSRKGLLEDLHGLCEDDRIVRKSFDMFRSGVCSRIEHLTGRLYT